MFWDDVLTLKTILVHHKQAPGFFRVPLFRLLSEEEQLLVYGDRFETIATDACMLSGGGFATLVSMLVTSFVYTLSVLGGT